MKAKNFRMFLSQHQHKSVFDLMLMSKASQEISTTDNCNEVNFAFI